MKRLLLVLFALGCGITNDPSMELTGTEEDAVMPPGGGSAAPSCPSTKVLICHIPPGNPANAHSICVGPPAWPPHHRLHGDTMGACGPATTGGGSDAGQPPPPPPPPADAGAPACVPLGAACNTDSTCCGNVPCSGGFCTPIIP